MAKKAMTPTAAARIQAAEAKGNGGKVAAGGFAARAQAAAAGSPSTATKPTQAAAGKTGGKRK